MGWWPFGSSSSSPPAAADVSKPFELLPPISTSSASSAEQPRRLTKEQQADAELESFLASLEGGPKKKEKQSAPTVSPPAQEHTQQSQPSSLWASLRRQAPVYPPEPTDSSIHPSVPQSESDTSPKLDISPRALRPRTMSCRAAFDSAFYCASLGGKFNDVYRFGALQPCSEHWDAFWFCMRNRSIGGSDDDRGEDIAEYYEKREQRELIRRAGGRSSEDIWEMRTEPVEKAFWKIP